MNEKDIALMFFGIIADEDDDLSAIEEVMKWTHIFMVPVVIKVAFPVPPPTSWRVWPMTNMKPT